METTYKQKAKEVRKSVLQMSFDAGACHIGSALSCVDFCVVIDSFARTFEDKIVFSKASGAATVYALNEGNAKYLKENPLCWPGGSLGHGLPVAVGMALPKRKKVYCIMSDAELNEGTTWESLLFASQHNLANLVIVIDYNRLQSCGNVGDILELEPLKDKFKAFGCDVRVIDGHNHKAIEKCLWKRSDKPKVIIAKTTKGKGVDFMEGDYTWHYRNLTPALLASALDQI